MSVLSAALQTQVENSLVDDKILTLADITELKQQSKDTSTPFFSLLVTSGKVSNEQLTKPLPMYLKYRMSIC